MRDQADKQLAAGGAQVRRKPLLSLLITQASWVLGTWSPPHPEQLFCGLRLTPVLCLPVFSEEAGRCLVSEK